MVRGASSFVARWPGLAIVLSMGGLLAFCFINRLIFSELFGLDYIRWYVSAGPIIALATAAFGTAWGGLDKHAELVSANPFFYVAACLQIAGLPLSVFGAHIQAFGADLRSGRLYNLPPWELLAVVSVLPLTLVFAISVTGWFLFVVPLQYFVFFFCGAPSRIAMASSVSVHAHFDEQQGVEYETRPRQDPLAQGWWDASMRDKPITLTSAFRDRKRGQATFFRVGGQAPDRRRAVKQDQADGDA